MRVSPNPYPSEPVALPEIGNYTDQLTIYPNFPVGCDESLIGVRLDRVHDVTRMALLGGVVVRSDESASATESMPAIGGVSDGTATAVGFAIRRKKLSEIDGGTETEPDVNIRVNNAEMEDRIRGDGKRWRRGVFDEAARSCYLDLAMRRGLASASRARLIPNKSLIKQAALFPFYVGLQEILGGSNPEVLVHAVESTFIAGLILATIKRRETGINQLSLFSDAHFDRYAVVRRQLLRKLIVPIETK